MRRCTRAWRLLARVSAARAGCENVRVLRAPTSPPLTGIVPCKPAASDVIARSCHGFTHLDESGSLPRMVDVGDKKVTRRTARARCVVRLPPHVLRALGGEAAQGGASSVTELQGPKVRLLLCSLTNPANRSGRHS